jgi:hypothetical protein
MCDVCACVCVRVCVWVMSVFVGDVCVQAGGGERETAPLPTVLVCERAVLGNKVHNGDSWARPGYG